MTKTLFSATRKALLRGIAGVLASVTLAALWTPPAMAAATCDEACLRQTMDNYLDALVAHDASRLGGDLSHIRNLEKGVVTPLGEGLWQTATGDFARKIYVPDVKQQSIAFLGTMTEAGQPQRSYIGVALQLKDGRIASIESTVKRGMGSNQRPEARQARAAFSELTPPADRMSREELIKRSGAYFDALQNSDSKLAPFGPRCERYENGDDMGAMRPPPPKAGEKAPPMPPMAMPAALPGVPMVCNFTKVFPPMVKISNRHAVAVDESRSLVMWVASFDQVGRITPEIEEWNKTVPPERRMTDASKMMHGSAPVFELFRIRDGKIAEVDAIF